MRSCWRGVNGKSFFEWKRTLTDRDINFSTFTYNGSLDGLEISPLSLTKFRPCHLALARSELSVVGTPQRVRLGRIGRLRMLLVEGLLIAGSKLLVAFRAGSSCRAATKGFAFPLVAGCEPPSKLCLSTLVQTDILRANRACPSLTGPS